MTVLRHPIIVATLAMLGASPSAFATDPQRLYERYSTICAEITELHKSPGYEGGTYEERRSMERRVIQSAYDVPEVRQTFQAIAQADPNGKYQLLERSVERQTARSWTCDALRRVR